MKQLQFMGENEVSRGFLKKDKKRKIWVVDKLHEEDKNLSGKNLRFWLKEGNKCTKIFH